MAPNSMTPAVSAADAAGGSALPPLDASADNDSAGEVSQGPPPQDAASGVGLDATDLDAPGRDPAYVSCGADAAEAGYCPLPYSVCADRRWLVFYDNAQCVSGACAWEKRYVDCGNIGCLFGQCRPPFTL